MTVAASILLAAVVGGVVFVLIDGWQRREEEAPARPAPAPSRPAPRPTPAPPAPRPNAPVAPSPLWSGWAEREHPR
jgi:hypothetical protein